MLGWAPRSNEEAVVATAESLQRLGLLKDSCEEGRLIQVAPAGRGDGRYRLSSVARPVELTRCQQPTFA
jgi:hypothetical protein